MQSFPRGNGASAVLSWVVKVRQAEREKVRAGPWGFLLSRTATKASFSATSTHCPPLGSLWLLLRQAAISTQRPPLGSLWLLLRQAAPVRSIVPPPSG